jgi:hypothetical protein
MSQNNLVEIPEVVHDLFFAHFNYATPTCDATTKYSLWWPSADLEEYFTGTSFISFTPFCTTTRKKDNIKGTLVWDAELDVFHSFVPETKENESE